ncbi:MAG: response regulator [Chloroherpetonaceae bacterium]
MRIHIAFAPNIDTPNNLVALRELFEHDYFVYTADSFERAFDILQQKDIAVLTIEAILNGEESTPFIAALRDLKPNVVVIMLTGSKDSSLAIRLINEGRIFRYLVKPFTRQILKETLRVAIEQYNNPTTIETLARHFEHKSIFNSDAPKVKMHQLSDVIRRVNERLARVDTY